MFLFHSGKVLTLSVDSHCSWNNQVSTNIASIKQLFYTGCSVQESLKVHLENLE